MGIDDTSCLKGLDLLFCLSNPIRLELPFESRIVPGSIPLSKSNYNSCSHFPSKNSLAFLTVLVPVLSCLAMARSLMPRRASLVTLGAISWYLKRLSPRQMNSNSTSARVRICFSNVHHCNEGLYRPHRLQFIPMTWVTLPQFEYKQFLCKYYFLERSSNCHCCKHSRYGSIPNSIQLSDRS